MKRGRRPKLATAGSVEKFLQGRDARISAYAERHSTEEAAVRFNLTQRRVQQIARDVAKARELHRPVERRQQLYTALVSGYSQAVGELLTLAPQLGLTDADIEQMPRRAWLAMVKLHRRLLAAEARAVKAEAALGRQRTREVARTLLPSYSPK